MDYENPSNSLYFLAGEAGAGKSTAAQQISEIMSLRTGNCSDVLYTEVARRMRKSESEVRAIPKELIRSELVLVGNELADRNATAMVDSLIASGVRVIAGIRRPQELAVAKEKYREHGYDVKVLFVKNDLAPKRQDNNAITPEHADFVIENEAGYESLWNQVAAIATPSPSRRVSANRRMTILRGIVPGTPDDRTKGLTGKVVRFSPGKEEKLAEDTAQHLAANAPSILVMGGFEALHSMRGIVHQACAQGYTVDISSPARDKGERYPEGWEVGAVPQVLASRSPDTRVAAFSTTYRRALTLENVFERNEALEHLRKMYAPEVAQLHTTGFFLHPSNYEGELAPRPLWEDVLVSERNSSESERSKILEPAR